VTTTYHTLVADYKDEKNKDEKSPLHKFEWFRIVLDEGLSRHSLSTKPLLT
jgi:SNF2 family DNA or RNA helicase